MYYFEIYKRMYRRIPRNYNYDVNRKDKCKSKTDTESRFEVVAFKISRG